MKIIFLNLRDLTNQRHWTFHMNVRDLIMEHDPEALGVAALYEQYQQHVANEEEAIEYESRSDLTRMLNEQDAGRDDTFVGISLHLEAFLHHFNPAKKEAAMRINKYMEHYQNLHRRSLDEETGAIRSFIADLNGNCPNDVELLGLTEWLAELETRNEAFNQMYRSRIAEAAERNPLRMADARKQVDAAYKAITTRINALIEVNGEAAYTILVNKLNASIEKTKLLLAQQEGRKDKGEPDATIPGITQPIA